jgi:hypothetical protein
MYLLSENDLDHRMKIFSIDDDENEKYVDDQLLPPSMHSSSRGKNWILMASSMLVSQRVNIKIGCRNTCNVQQQ